MRSYLRLSKLGPRYVALQRHWGPLALSSRSGGAPVCSDLPTISTADSKRNPRHMSVNTKGASAASSGKQADDSDEEDNYHTVSASKIVSASASKSSGEVSANQNQNQRDTYEEKQSDTHVDFARVKEPPPPSAEHWWFPDPFTGHFVPRSQYGEISSNGVLKEGKHIPLSSSSDTKVAGKKPPAPAPAFKKLSGTPSKGEKGGWWTSMEELPDLDAQYMRCEV